MEVDALHYQPPKTVPDHDPNEDTSDVSRQKEAENVAKWQPRTVSVEPVLFMYLLGGGLTWPAFSALIYKKVCISSFDNLTCSNLHNETYHEQEDIVQGQTSHWFLWHNYVFEIPGIILAIGYGSLSDHFSRRLTIALPVVGQVLSVGSFIVCAFYMRSHVGYTLIGGTISGISGGWITLFMACFSYLGEATSFKDRTRRVLIAEGVAGLSVSIALVLSGIILDHTNYIFVFSLSVSIYVVCTIYIVVYIKEPPKKLLVAEKGKQTCSLFLHRMRSALTVVFKKRENNGRMRILITMGIILTSMISGNAVHTVGFLFLKRSPLSWTQSEYGVFLALHSFIPSFVLLFIIPWIRTKFNLRDTTVLMIGLSSHCLSEFYFSFCTRSWMVFIMPVLAAFRSGGTVLRSTLSQLVAPHELGKMFAILGAVQSFSGIVGSTLYNTIYPHTLTFWPGFCFTLGTMIAIIPASMTWWLHRDLIKSPIYEQLQETELEPADGFRDKDPLLNGDRDPLLYGDASDELNEEDELPGGLQMESVII